MLMLGLLLRSAAAVLLGMTVIIELFEHLRAWPTHIQWATMLLPLLCRGAGFLSTDHWLWKKISLVAA